MDRCVHEYKVKQINGTKNVVGTWYNGTFSCQSILFSSENDYLFSLDFRMKHDLSMFF